MDASSRQACLPPDSALVSIVETFAEIGHSRESSLKLRSLHSAARWNTWLRTLSAVSTLNYSQLLMAEKAEMPHLPIP